MSYTWGIPRAAESTMPIAAPSSWEWITSYRSREHATHGRERQRQVEGNLLKRGTDPHPVQKRRTQAAEHAQARQIDGLAKRVGDEIDRVPELEERPDAVILAEGRATGLEEGLRSDHQDAHE